MINEDFTLVGHNFHYTIDVDYNHSYPGFNGCECPEWDYCRCQVINEEDIKINFSSLTPFDILTLFIDVSNKKQYERDKKIGETLNDDITEYGIGRIMSINGMYDKYSYDFLIEGGYYGAEFEGLKLRETIAKNITEQIHHFLKLDSLKEKVEYLLLLEYDHVLDSIKHKNWKIIEVNKDDIAIPNAQHYKNVPQLDFYNDSNYKDIRCIIRETGVKKGSPYKLVDGYHRLKNTKKKTVKCLLAYE
jgi:hypothetical protein